METPRLGRSKAKAVLNSSTKVRVIAKIRGLTDLEAESTDYVSVHKPNGFESENVSISFGVHSCSRKELYELDYYYEQNEGNAMIFSREIRSLISGVFNGRNATDIAYGARGSGKTHVIQGSDKDPGLAVLAMSEILAMDEEFGRSISISSYEIFQDHVYDILDPKRQPVLILENDRGEIQLKGLSQVPVKCIYEFLKLIGHNSHKQIPRRSHKGLIIHMSSLSNALPMGKMNLLTSNK